jgi:hypothetical protein
MVVLDGELMIDICVKHNGLLKRVDLGRIRLSMVEVAAMGVNGIVNQGYPLANENLEFDGNDRGMLFLELKWIYDAATGEFASLSDALPTI